MGMNVDDAGGHPAAVRIDDQDILLWQVLADGGDTPVPNQDIALADAATGTVENGGADQ